MTDKKNLPIKIFEKRQELDERLTEGGGSSKPLSWVLSGDELKSKAQILADDLDNSYGQIEKKLEKYKGTPAILRAKINDNILAKSHRKDISEFFAPSNQQKYKLLGVTGNQELLVKIENSKQMMSIKERLVKFERNEKVISGVESLTVFNPTIITEGLVPDKNGKYLLKIRFIDFHNFQLNEHVLNVFNSLIANEKKILLEKSVKYTENLVVHQISVDSLEVIEIFADFSPIMSIEPMPIIEIVEDDFFTENQLKFSEPEPDTEYTTVGILDSGIAPIDPLEAWTLKKRHTNYPPHLIKPDHGTFVAGIVNFGDILENQEYTGTKGFKLFDAAVFPDGKHEKISEAELVDNVREAIESNPEIKIWNMSLGSNAEIKYGEFSEFGTALDNIQDENDVLIIKSAGNCQGFLDGKPISKIAIGADSVRSLTVGSIAHKEDSGDLSIINHRSPFSRIGPGPANIIKPELVHYGGNAKVVKGKLITNGVKSLAVNGALKPAVGTSFSTPRVTAIAADLSHKLKEEFDSVLIKALLLHSAKYPENVDLPINEKINQLGFGVPSKADDILFNDQHEITLVLRDTLNKGEFVEIMDFPFPTSLINDEGYFYGQIFLTLVNTPILATGQGAEYCQSNLEVLFGTFDEKVPRSGRTIRNPIGRKGGQNLLLASNYSTKKDPAKRGFPRSEKIAIQYGDKFYPNKKYALDITNLKKGNKEKFIKAPKKWFLKIEGLYREFIESQEEDSRVGLSQDFCVILTIRDPQRKHNVYDEVTTLLDSNNFINRNIELNTDISIDLDDKI
ncbi:S8 family peptidase [Bacillaceae bacterium IKA-2]|nr:S8 family peptidase [Bacillaceae bacterium IKA-2]